MEEPIQFTVFGKPKTAGSKTSFIPKRKDGSMVTRPDGEPMVVTNDSSGAEGKAWRQEVAAQAIEASGGEMLEGPLAVELVFVFQRPRSHWRTGRNAHLLRDSAPSAPATRPDALKLARAVEDALTSVVYRDDAQIVDEHIQKSYGEPERCEVLIRRLFPVMADGQERLIAA